MSELTGRSYGRAAPAALASQPASQNGTDSAKTSAKNRDGEPDARFMLRRPLA